jgi:hypothetical protein
MISSDGAWSVISHGGAGAFDHLLDRMIGGLVGNLISGLIPGG